MAAAITRQLRSRGPAPDNGFSQAERDALVLGVMPQVRALVKNLARARRDRDLRDELFGEAMVTCVRLARTFRPRGDRELLGLGAEFATYAVGHLRRSLSGQKVDDFERRQRFRLDSDVSRPGRRARSVSVVHAAADPRAGGAADDADDLDDAAGEIGRAVRRVLFSGALDRLRPEARDIVEAVAVDGLDVHQAARRFDRPARVVRLVLRNAAVKLAGRGTVTPVDLARGHALFRAGVGKRAAADLGVRPDALTPHWHRWKRGGPTRPGRKAAAAA